MCKSIFHAFLGIYKLAQNFLHLVYHRKRMRLIKYDAQSSNFFQHENLGSFLILFIFQTMHSLIEKPDLNRISTLEIPRI